jgi:hypothetical protein
LRSKSGRKTRTKWAKAKRNFTIFILFFCPTEGKNDVLPRSWGAKAKGQKLEWQKKNGQNPVWQKQKIPN